MDQEKSDNRIIKRSGIFIAVKNVEEQVRFYREYIGLDTTSEDENSISLGKNNIDFIVLQTDGDDHPRNRVAIRVPDRRELARVVARLCTVNYPNLALDHGFRQATYLFDGAKNEIEIYVENEGKSKSDVKKVKSQPLDLEKLFNELKPDDRLCDGMPGNTEAGHFLENNL